MLGRCVEREVAGRAARSGGDSNGGYLSTDIDIGFGQAVEPARMQMAALSSACTQHHEYTAGTDQYKSSQPEPNRSGLAPSVTSESLFFVTCLQ